MELTVARLKVLGEKDIADLDKKIADYKASNNPTILNKDLETIQREIQQGRNKYYQLENEKGQLQSRHSHFINERNQFNQQYKKLEDELKKMKSDIDEIFIELPEYKSKIAEKQAEVSKLFLELTNAKAKFANIIEENKTQDAEYQENLKAIRESVARVEAEIREHQQQAYQRYLDYETAVKSVSLDAITKRKPVNANFAEMVPDLLRVFAGNMNNFVKVREFYKELITCQNIDIGINFQGASDIIKNTHSSFQKYLTLKKHAHSFIGLIHENVCELIVNETSLANLIGRPAGNPQIPPLYNIGGMYLQKSEDKLRYTQENEKYLNITYPDMLAKYNIYMDKLKNNVHKWYNYCVCPNCGYTDFKNVIVNTNQTSGCNKKNILDIDKFNKWLDRNYKKLCQSVITDAKLNAVIQNTTYAELFDMLGSVFDIRGYNTYEFLLFLVFLGTGGRAHNLYEEF